MEDLLWEDDGDGKQERGSDPVTSLSGNVRQRTFIPYRERERERERRVRERRERERRERDLI